MNKIIKNILIVIAVILFILIFLILIGYIGIEEQSFSSGPLTTGPVNTN